MLKEKWWKGGSSFIDYPKNNQMSSLKPDYNLQESVSTKVHLVVVTMLLSWE